MQCKSLPRRMSFVSRLPFGGGNQWTNEMQKDWIAFQIKKQHDYIEQMLCWLQCTTFWLLVGIQLLSDLCLELSGRDLIFCSWTSWLVASIVLSKMLGPFARRSVGKRPMLTGIVIQIFFLIAMEIACVACSLKIKDAFMQHRHFLFYEMLVLITGIWFCSTPIWVTVFIGAPVILTAWFCFHFVVGYWSTSMVIWGSLLTLIVACYTAWVDQSRWQKFQTDLQLDRGRQTLEDMQSALQCMLSSLWDASCTCNPDGKIVSTTPHLEHILAEGVGVAGLNLLDFVADASDIERLQNFLYKTASSTAQQTLSLQCSFRPLTLGSSQHAVASRSCEVSIYGVRLPSGAVLQSSAAGQQCGDLFIGMRASATEMCVQDACAPNIAFLREPTSSDDERSLGEAARWSVTEFASEHAVAASDVLSSKNLSIGGSLTYSQSSRQTCKERIHGRAMTSVGVQTERLSAPVPIQTEQGSFLSSPASSNERTDDFHESVKVPKMERRLKPNDQPASAFTGSAGWPPRPHGSRVQRRTSRRVLMHFAETPSITICHLIQEVLIHVNPRGKGCCAWHVGLRVLLDSVRELLSEHCDSGFTPLDGWQCTTCKAMNELGGSDSEEWECSKLESCEACEAARKPHIDLGPASTSDSSYFGDTERVSSKPPFAAILQDRRPLHPTHVD